MLLPTKKQPNMPSCDAIVDIPTPTQTATTTADTTTSNKETTEQACGALVQQQKYPQ